jgi:hypothetical protein
MSANDRFGSKLAEADMTATRRVRWFDRNWVIDRKRFRRAIT